MLKYLKETPRISVVYLDGRAKREIDTIIKKYKLFEVSDRDWSNVGELYTDYHADQLIQRTIEEKDFPDSVLVLTNGEYLLYEDDSE